MEYYGGLRLADNKNKNGAKQMDEITKKKNGQSGADGNSFLRTKRIEIRLAPYEFRKVEEAAQASGFSNLAQYLRETGLATRQIDSPSTRQKEKSRWLYELNRVGNNINQIVRRLNGGQQPDDEILMVLLQIQEMAEAIHSEAFRNSKGGA